MPSCCSVLPLRPDERVIWKFSASDRREEPALRLGCCKFSTQLRTSGARTSLPYTPSGFGERKFVCTRLRGSRVEQEPIVMLGENIFPLPTIEPGLFHRAASNPDTVPTPSTCVSTTTTTTTTTNEHQPSKNRHNTAKKAVGKCAYSEIRVDFRSPNKSLAVRLCDICCSIEENRTKGEPMWSHAHTHTHTHTYTHTYTHTHTHIHTYIHTYRLPVNLHNDRGATWGQAKDICCRGKAFRSSKSTPQSEDKINDCGNLSHNTANDFQWSINTSMPFFLWGKKKKGKVWRANSDVYGNISIHACVFQWCTGSQILGGGGGLSNTNKWIKCCASVEHCVWENVLRIWGGVGAFRRTTKLHRRPSTPINHVNPALRRWNRVAMHSVRPSLPKKYLLPWKWKKQFPLKH